MLNLRVNAFLSWVEIIHMSKFICMIHSYKNIQFTQSKDLLLMMNFSQLFLAWILTCVWFPLKIKGTFTLTLELSNIEWNATELQLIYPQLIFAGITTLDLPPRHYQPTTLVINHASSCHLCSSGVKSGAPASQRHWFDYCPRSYSWWTVLSLNVDERMISTRDLITTL